MVGGGLSYQPSRSLSTCCNLNRSLERGGGGGKVGAVVIVVVKWLGGWVGGYFFLYHSGFRIYFF